MAIATVVMVMVFLTLILSVLMQRTAQQASEVSQDRRWEAAIQVADGGVDLLLLAIDTDPAFTTGQSPADLGTKSQVIAAADSMPESGITSFPEGEAVVLRASGSSTGYVVGFAPSRAASDRQVRIIEVRWEESGGEVTGRLPFQDAAITANGDVKFSGGSGTTSDPEGDHAGHVIGNGVLDADGYVNGDVSVAGIVKKLSGGAYGTVESGAPPIDFPTPTETAAWQAQLESEALAGGKLSGWSGGGTLTSPVYIDGDLSVGGEVLEVVGGGVVYVKGKVTLSGGATLVNGGIFAAGGIIKFSGGSQYQVAGDATSAGLIGFATNSKAIELSGSSMGVSQGAVYAPNGGVLLSGSSTFYGGIVAGGSGGLGKVEMSGGSKISYPSGLFGSVKWGPAEATAADLGITFLGEL